ncbi:MAG: SDR family NAD(P)-dependent oxidoreductase [Bacteriovoracales bacterium]|nr:SDR family NAD(P)-dependent oxidoreductase [Bacteriovoracales bacterium]
MNLLIITGASRGIGKATAKLFLDHSYKVVNISRTPCPLEGIVNIPVDLACFDEKALEGLDSILDEASQITLIHNAFRLEKDRVDNAKALREVLAVNIEAPAKLNALIIPKMLAKEKSGHSILYVGSTLSEKAVPKAFSYVTTKHAMAGMMKAGCQDMMGKGVHTALICPGFTDTEMLRDHAGLDENILRSMAQTNSYGRLIRPQEIAETLLFSATHPVVNGSVLHVNLGQREI